MYSTVRSEVILRTNLYLLKNMTSVLRMKVLNLEHWLQILTLLNGSKIRIILKSVKQWYNAYITSMTLDSKYKICE